MFSNSAQSALDFADFGKNFNSIFLHSLLIVDLRFWCVAHIKLEAACRKTSVSPQEKLETTAITFPVPCKLVPETLPFKF